MKTRIASAIALAAGLCLVATAPARADGNGSMIEIGGSLNVIDTNRPDPADTIVSGSVYISHKGTLTVIWDGVQINGGSYGFTTRDGQVFHWNINLPSVILDLQKILGVEWMKAIQLTAASYGRDDDPTRNTVDTYIGKIMLNLTQTVYSDEKFSLEVSEGAGFAGHFSRYYNETDVTSESVPVYFNLSTTAVEKISPSVAVALGIGAYATIYNQINSPNQDRFGAWINPELRVGRAFATGVRAEYMERLLFADETTHQHAIQASAYVKYVLSAADADVRHSIQLQVGHAEDQTIPVEGGLTLNNTFGKLIYTVAF